MNHSNLISRDTNETPLVDISSAIGNLKIDTIEIEPQKYDEFENFDFSNIEFAISPFYKEIERIEASIFVIDQCVKETDDSKQFTLDSRQLKLLNSSSSNKLYLFCGEIDDLNNETDGRIKLSFPHPMELHINDKIFSKNLRGIKKRKGTVYPADITNLVIGNGLNNNKIKYKHGIIRQKYLLYCTIVETRSAEKLLAQILDENEIVPLEKSIGNLKESNVDIIASSIIISLLCPISVTKLKYPMLSKNCKHIECFDALWFLTAQQQIPSWECPICKSKCEIKDLVISEFVIELLENSENSTEYVKVFSDGSWEEILEESESEDYSSTSTSSIVNVSSLKTTNTADDMTGPDRELEIISISDFEDNASVLHHSGSVQVIKELPEPVTNLNETYDFDNSIFVPLNSENYEEPHPFQSRSNLSNILTSKPFRNKTYQRTTTVKNILGTPPLTNESKFSTFDPTIDNSLLSTSTSFGSFNFSVNDFTIKDNRVPLKKPSSQETKKPNTSKHIKLPRDRRSQYLNAYIQELDGK